MNKKILMKVLIAGIVIILTYVFIFVFSLFGFNVFGLGCGKFNVEKIREENLKNPCYSNNDCKLISLGCCRESCINKKITEFYFYGPIGHFCCEKYCEHLEFDCICENNFCALK